MTDLLFLRLRAEVLASRHVSRMSSSARVKVVGTMASDWRVAYFRVQSFIRCSNTHSTAQTHTMGPMALTNPSSTVLVILLFTCTKVPQYVPTSDVSARLPQPQGQ